MQQRCCLQPLVLLLKYIWEVANAGGLWGCPWLVHPVIVCVSVHITLHTWVSHEGHRREPSLGQKAHEKLTARCHNITVTSLVKPPWRLQACNWIIQENPFRMRMVPTFLIISGVLLKRIDFQKCLYWWTQTWPVKDKWYLTHLRRGKSGAWSMDLRHWKAAQLWDRQRRGL